MILNHKQARSLLEQAKGNKELEIFLQEKKAVITKQIDVIGNNTELLNSFVTSLGSKCAGYTEIEAIGVLETLYDVYSTTYKVGDHDAVDDVFSKAYTSMCKAAIRDNKYSLKKFIDKIYDQPVLMNHTKALQFCETKIYIEVGAKEGLIDMITNKILQAPGKYILKDLMEDLGVTFAHSDPKEAIGVWEAIHDVLNLENINSFIREKKLLDNDTTINNLFCEAFDNMYETAINYRNEDLLNHLKTYYLEPEPLQEQDIIADVAVSGEIIDQGG